MWDGIGEGILRERVFVEREFLERGYL